MVKLNAYFTDEAYAAFKQGDAMFNNGFRAKEGNFWPEQPTFTECRTPKENHAYQEHKSFSNANGGKDMFKRILMKAGEELLVGAVVPVASQLICEKAYPAISRKIDEAAERHAEKKAAKCTDRNYVEEYPAGVIPFPHRSESEAVKDFTAEYRDTDSFYDEFARYQKRTSAAY